MSADVLWSTEESVSSFSWCFIELLAAGELEDKAGIESSHVDRIDMSQTDVDPIGPLFKPEALGGDEETCWVPFCVEVRSCIKSCFFLEVSDHIAVA